MRLTDRELEILRELEKRPRRVLGDPDRPGPEQAHVAELMKPLIERGLAESGPGHSESTGVRREQIVAYDTLTTRGYQATEYRITDAGRDLLRERSGGTSSGDAA